MNPLEVKKENIWSYKQNKPSLIARDLNQLFNVPVKAALQILLARGVFKWLAVRRDLIKLKNDWRDKIVELNKEVVKLRKEINASSHPAKQYQYGYMKGYKKALEDARADVRTLCHSERWRAPDFDVKALDIIEND